MWKKGLVEEADAIVEPQLLYKKYYRLNTHRFRMIRNYMTDMTAFVCGVVDSASQK